MYNVDVDFKCGEDRIGFQLLNLSEADAKTLYRILRKAANNGSNDHISSFGWYSNNEGVMVSKGEK